MLNGKKLKISVDTNINTGKKVVLNKAVYKINRINNSNIGASNTTGSIEVYFGPSFDEEFLGMSTQHISDCFELKNEDEINCI